MEGRHGSDMGGGGGSPRRAFGVWLGESLINGVDSHAPPPNLVIGTQVPDDDDELDLICTGHRDNP